MPSPKEDAEDLMNELLPRALELLQKHREFFPIGASMAPTRGIQHEAAYNGEEQPPSQELIDLLRKAHSAAASNGEILACAIAYDVRTTPPGRETKQDAIAVELDHRDSYSVVVIFPYMFDDWGQLEVSEPFAVTGKSAIFGVNT